MYSLRRFSQWLVLRVVLDFQFNKIVFLARVKATRTDLEYLCGRCVVERSPNKQRDGDNGMPQLNMRERVLVTDSQKCCIGGQDQVECR